MAVLTSTQKNKKVLICSVLTIAGQIIRSMRIEHVEIPTEDGVVSIYVDHAPYIVAVHYGELKIVDENKKSITLYVEDGIAEVTNNTVGILVQKAILPKDIKEVSISSEIKKIESQSVINYEENLRNREKVKRLKKQLEVLEHSISETK